MTSHRDPSRDVNSSDPTTETWVSVFEACTPGLRAMLSHRLRNDGDVDDCLQNVFITTVRKGHEVAPAARRAWLFRVARNEAALFWRKEEVKTRSLEKLAMESSANVDDAVPDPAETTDDERLVAAAIAELPESMRLIVELRIHHDLTFQQIADRLNIPIGTALTRMRRALARIKTTLTRTT